MDDTRRCSRPHASTDAGGSTASADPNPLPPGQNWSRFRLVAVDLDGTLADAEGRIGPDALRALREADHQGLHPVIVTGRALPAALGVWLRANLSSPVIACGGALITWPATGSVLWERPLDADTVDRVLAVAERYGLVPFLYTASAIATDRRGPLRDRLARLNQLPVQVLGDGPEADGGDGGQLSQWQRGSVLKVVLGGEDQVLAAARAALDEALADLGARCHATLPSWLEVVRADATKEAALAELCRRLGLQPAQVMAVGDGENDLGMLRWAGLAVVPANGVEAARREAHWIIGHHAQGAVARFLRAVLDARTAASPSAP